MTKLLTTQSTKIAKGEKLGYLTAVLYLSPERQNSEGRNLCPKAGACRALCLMDSGLLGLPASQQAQRNRTEWFLRDHMGFENQLVKEIIAHIKRAKKLGMTPVVRINGTSDLPGLARRMARRFPDTMFYDYTKILSSAQVQAGQSTAKYMSDPTENYHLTFSHDGPGNVDECLSALADGISVAVAFDTKRGKALPAAWYGWPVIDGDETDLRFLDRRGVVVGLRAKGRARKIRNGFVVETETQQVLGPALQGDA